MNHSQKIITKCDGIITNCDSLVYYKAQWTLQIATAFLLQSATRIIKKLRQVLQSAMIIKNCDSTLGGNWRGNYSWGYKEYNAIITHTSLSQWHQLAHNIY